MRVLLLLALVIASAGCALPPPLSEGVMFAEGTYGRERTLPLPPARHRTTYRIVAGLGSAASFYPPSFGPQLAQRQGHEYGGRQNGFYQISLPAPQLGVGDPDWGAAAVGIGLMSLSANATVRLWGPSYLTLNAMTTPAWAQGEAILQLRLLRARGSGFGAGLFARFEWQDDALILAEDGPVGVHVLGARAAFRFDGDWLRVQGYTSVGVAPEYGVPVVGIGLTQTF